jgi:cell division protein FtsW
VFLNGLVLMFIAKVNIKYLFSIIGLGFCSALVIYGAAKIAPEFSEKIMPRSATWVSRVDGFINTDQVNKLAQDYQQQQALVAIYNGGFSGVGPGKSTQRNILPYSSSDFVFAIMVEEYGLLLGALLPILLYLILFYRALRIASKITSVFGGLICIGLMFSLVFQAFVNMLVSVGVLPVTGQTLPLISMGGTSIVFTCITLGIILSVSNDTSDRAYETA